MKDHEDQLARLLRGAARHPAEKLSSAPAGFATHTVAQWQLEHRANDRAVALVCRGAILSALTLAGIAFIVAYPEMEAKPQAVRYFEQLSLVSRLELMTSG